MRLFRRRISPKIQRQPEFEATLKKLYSTAGLATTITSTLQLEQLQAIQLGFISQARDGSGNRSLISHVY